VNDNHVVDCWYKTYMLNVEKLGAVIVCIESCYGIAHTNDGELLLNMCIVCHMFMHS